MKKNLLIVIFAILFIITLGEVIYYLYLNHFFGLNPLVTKSENQAIISEVSRTDAPTAQPTIKERAVDPALYDKYIQSVDTAFKRAPQNKDQKITLIFEQNGIVRIDKDKENNRYITIVDDKGNKIFTLGSNYYKYLYKIENDKKTPITIDKVSDGDRISDIEYFSVYNASPSVELLIYGKK